MKGVSLTVVTVLTEKVIFFQKSVSSFKNRVVLDTNFSIYGYCCPLKLFIQNKLGLTLLTKYQPF